MIQANITVSSKLMVSSIKGGYYAFIIMWLVARKMTWPLEFDNVLSQPWFGSSCLTLIPKIWAWELPPTKPQPQSHLHVLAMHAWCYNPQSSLRILCEQSPQVQLQLSLFTLFALKAITWYWEISMQGCCRCCICLLLILLWEAQLLQCTDKPWNAQLSLQIKAFVSNQGPPSLACCGFSILSVIRWRESTHYRFV